MERGPGTAELNWGIGYMHTHTRTRTRTHTMCWRRTASCRIQVFSDSIQYARLYLPRNFLPSSLAFHEIQGSIMPSAESLEGEDKTHNMPTLSRGSRHSAPRLSSSWWQMQMQLR